MTALSSFASPAAVSPARSARFSLAPLALLAALAVTGPAQAQLGATEEEWVGPMGPDNAWIYSIAVDPTLADVVYASSGMIYKSTDGGQSWIAGNYGLDTSRKVIEIVVDPSDSSAVYAATRWGGQIYRSLDGGESWQMTAVLGSSGAFDLAVDPADSTTLYAVKWEDAVLKSTDTGSTWNPLAGFPVPPTAGLAIDPQLSSTIYAGSYNGVAKSVDGGVTWTSHPLGVSDDVPVVDLAIDPSAPSTLYAVAASGRGNHEGGCYKSTDGGTSWSQVLAHRSIRTLAIDPRNPSRLYASGPGAVLRSTDSGATWSTSVPGYGARGINDLAVDPLSPSTVYAAASNCCDISPGIVKSTDGGVTWEPANQGIKSLGSIAVDPLDPATLYAANGWAGAYRSSDGGLSWERIDRDSAGERIYFSWSSIAAPPAPNAATLYALSSGGFLKSRNRGESWELSNQGLPGASRYGPLVVDPDTPSTLYLATGSGLFKSLDEGDSWASLQLDLKDVRTFAIDPASPTTMFAGAWGEGLFKSTDGGAQWTRISEYPWWRAPLEIDPNSDVYATSLTRLNKSTDGGATWVTLPLWPYVLLIDPLDPRILYAGTVGSGVLRSADAGATWVAIGGLPETHMSVTSMDFDPELPSTLYALYRGVYRITFAPRLVMLTPDRGIVGDPVTLSGKNFRPQQDGGAVTFNGIPAPVVSWSDREIVAKVPRGAAGGPVAVSVLGVASNTDRRFALDPLPVGIDLKPGSHPNCFNLDGHGVLPVAVLGSDELDVSEVLAQSLSFAGLAVRVRGNDAAQCSVEDASGDFAEPQGAPDGHFDLICQFVDDPDSWSAGDDVAVLSGTLFDGTPIRGEDEICVRP